MRIHGDCINVFKKQMMQWLIMNVEKDFLHYDQMEKFLSVFQNKTIQLNFIFTVMLSLGLKYHMYKVKILLTLIKFDDNMK